MFSLWNVFLAAFLFVAAWETFRPSRALETPTARRWLSHGILWAACGLTQRLALRISASALGLAAFNARFEAVSWNPVLLALYGIVGFLALDLTRYVLHRICHSIPLMWRFHSVHHSDPDFDLSTGVRFHPGEVLVTEGAYLVVIALITPPPLAVILYEAASSLETLFSHANAVVPPRMQRLLRLVVVTPDMHRVHHSRNVVDQQSNFGTLFPWWDRMFGTFCESGSGEVGLEGVNGVEAIGLRFMLTEPFMQFHADRVEVTRTD